MRDLKFRTWHNIDGYMIYPKDCTKFEINLSCKFEGFSFRIEWDKGKSAVLGSDKHITLMQYTGLKDKNGVEIFEGDIVNLDIDGEFMDGHRLTPDFKDPFIVEEKEGCFECRFIEGEKETFPISEYWQASNDLEVIGNIHENPDLLK